MAEDFKNVQLGPYKIEPSVNSLPTPSLLNPNIKLTTSEALAQLEDPQVTPEAARLASYAINGSDNEIVDINPDVKAAAGVTGLRTYVPPAATLEAKTDMLPFVPEYDSFKNYGRRNAGDTLQKSVGGSDLSVFYLSEIPNIDDVLSNPNRPELWRKELIIVELDNVLSLQYSTIRERYPVRTLGRVCPVAYTSGIRTIAGHMAFAVFAEDILGRLRTQVADRFGKLYRATVGALNTLEAEGFDDSMQSDTQKEFMDAKRDALEKKRYLYTVAADFNKVQLLDSLPPFHILVMGVNEQGTFSKFMIRGVRIIDENQIQGTTQPNIVNKVSWVATDIVPMAKFNYEVSPVAESMGSMTENYSSAGYTYGTENNVMTGTNLLSSVQRDLAKEVK